MATLQSVTVGTANQAGTITCDVTVNPGDDLCLVAAIHIETAVDDCSAMTRDGQSLVEHASEAAGTWARVEVWKLVNPNTGTNTLTATVAGTGADRARLAVWVLEDVDLTNPLTVPITDWGDTGLSSNLDTGAINPVDLVIDMLTLDAVGHTPTAGGTQTEDYNTNNGASNSFEMAGSDQSAEVGGNMSWTWSTSCPFAHMAMIVRTATTPPQRIRPDADIATTGWSTAPLWSKVDEDSPDTTYITGVAS